MGETQFKTYEGFTNQNPHQMLVFQYQNGAPVAVYPPKYAKGQPVYPFPGWR